MSDQDDFLLTRRDFQTSLVGSLQEETEFQDVTLACEDQQLRAHKLMLASSSTKLRSILLSNPHPHPLIYLHGVKFSVLQNIMIFIYTGEVRIRPDQVNSFLKVAQDLQVKGLSDQTDGGQTGGEVSTNTSTRNASSLAGQQRQRVKPPITTDMLEEQDVEKVGESQHSSEVTPDFREGQETPAVVKEQPSQENDEDNNSNSLTASYYYDQLSLVEEEEVIRPKMENMNTTEDIAEEDGQYEGEDGGDRYEDYEDGDDWSLPEAEEAGQALGEKTCPYCQKSFPTPSLLKRHIRSHTGEKPFSCPHCPKKFPQNSHLKRHIETVHLKMKPYQCPHCTRAFGQSNVLNSHIKTQHQK